MKSDVGSFGILMHEALTALAATEPNLAVKPYCNVPAEKVGYLIFQYFYNNNNLFFFVNSEMGLFKL